MSEAKAQRIEKKKEIQRKETTERDQRIKTNESRPIDRKERGNPKERDKESVSLCVCIYMYVCLQMLLAQALLFIILLF